MPDPKTIKLLVTIPDPRRRCIDVSKGEQCVLWYRNRATCLVGHLSSWDEESHSWLRPPSCKDAEVKP